MSQLIGYRTGGTVHIVTNNQIGFTTVPAHAHSGLYCTDIAKAVQAPILHVNGDDPEAVVFAARLCAEFRQKFATDVVLDIVCYRRYGHNETDEPAFTQPIMYKRIREMRTTRTLYARAAGRARAASRPRSRRRSWTPSTPGWRRPSRRRSPSEPNKADWLEGHWTGLKAAGAGENEERLHATAVPLETLCEVGDALVRVPEGFGVNPKIARQLEAKRQAIESGEGIDWATGEALGFGTLLLDGHRVRLSGEDVQRGTFSQRHAVLVDQADPGASTCRSTTSARARRGSRCSTRCCPSSACSGFEYGYSLADPHTLVLWEGAVRRLRQRRAGDHRPVHRLAARRSGCACRGSCCCCRTATRGRGRSTPRRGWSATCSSAPSGTCGSAT